MQDLPHDRLLCFESLESRRVLAAPNITALSAAASSLDPTGHLTVNASVTDADQDVREVAFYVDNGDRQFDASADQLIGRDSHATDGWQLSVPTSGPYHIMPLGDSVTQADGAHQSYRYPLWKNLIDADYNFDFVGSLTRNYNGVPSWPDYQSQSFDPQHEGHWGWRTDEVFRYLPDELQRAAVDIALVHLGTNDLFRGDSIDSTLNELQDVIGLLRRGNPHVAVLVANLIPTNFASNALINQFNAALPTRIDAWNSAASPVVLVDQNSAINAATHLYDGVHPNSVGERQMADTWSSAIASVRPLRDSSGQFSSSDQTFFAVAVDRNGNSSVAKSFTLGERPNETPSGGGGGENGVSESERTFVGNAVGNHTLTQTSDNQYQQLDEARVGSFARLEHVWQLSVPQTNDTSVRPKLKLEAFHSGANEVFYVNYSTDQINWRNVLTVSKSNVQTLEANLPAGLSGNVWIKIKDSSNDTSIDSVFIDYLSIQTAGGSTGPVPNPTPTPNPTPSPNPDPTDTSYFATGEVTSLGSQVGTYRDTFGSNDVRQQLKEDPSGRLLHQWAFQLPANSTATLSLEGFATGSNEVFWVNYSDDGIRFQNLLTIKPGSELKQSIRLPKSVSGAVYIKILDSVQGNDPFADSVFIDELKLTTD